MAFCRQVNNSVDMVLLHQLLNLVEVADVCFYERVIRLAFYIL